LKVGCERWLASFQTPRTLTRGQRLRKARKARSNLDALGSPQGRLGQRELPAAPKDTNASALCALEQPRRTAGIDSHGQAVRLGERDTDGHIAGYIDEDGLAWQSPTVRATTAERS
jgi:hypothetical protein